MIILFRPGLENNLVGNAVIKLNVTVAELLLVWFLNILFDSYAKKSKKKKKKRKKERKKEKKKEKKKKKKIKMKKCNGISSNCMSWIDK